MSMRCYVHIPFSVFLSVMLALWLFPEPSVAEEIKAKVLGVYQISEDKYELKATIIADQEISTQFRIQFGKKAEEGSINIREEWEIKAGEEGNRIKVEVPQISKNISKMENAWLVFRGTRGTRGWIHLAKNSGKIRYHPLDVKITALDNELEFRSAGGNTYTGELRVRSIGKANVEFILVFVGNSDVSSLKLLANEKEKYSTTTKEDKLTLKSTLLGEYLYDFESLRLKYQVEERSGWEFVETDSGSKLIPEVAMPDVKLRAEVVDVYQRAQDKYELVVRITTDRKIKAKFGIQFGQKAEQNFIDVPNEWVLRKEGSENKIQTEVPDIHKNINRIADARLVFKWGNEYRHLADDSGKINYHKSGSLRMNVHITKVNGKALQGKTVETYLSEGENGILTLKIITENYWSPFSTRVEYKTDSDATFLPLGEIEIDDNEVERDMKFRWAETSIIAVRITSDDPPLSNTALVNISAPPPGGGPSMMKRSRLWMADNLLYIIIIALIVITFVSIKIWWPRLIRKSSVKDIILTDDNPKAQRKIPGAVTHHGKKDWLDIKKSAKGWFIFTLNKSHAKTKPAGATLVSAIDFQNAKGKKVNEVIVKCESKVASILQPEEAKSDLIEIAKAVDKSGTGETPPPSDETSEDLVIAGLIRLLSDRTLSVSQKAAEALGNTGRSDNRINEALIKCLSDGSGIFRKSVVEALGKIDGGDGKKIEALTKCLSDTEPDVIMNAAEALRRIDQADDNTVNSLLKLFDNKFTPTRTRAADILGKICRANESSVESNIGILIGYLSFNVAYQRSSAALALGSIGRSDERIIVSLLTLLSDKSPPVRAGAAMALGEIGREDERVIFELLRLLSDEDKAVRESVATALGAIIKVDEEIEEEYPVDKKLQEIDIDDIIVLDEGNKYQLSFTIPVVDEPVVSKYPEWLSAVIEQKWKDKEWAIILKSGKDFQELKYCKLDIEAEGYHTKTATVIRDPIRVSEPPPQPPDPRPQSFKLIFDKINKNIIPAGSISLEIKDAGSKEESSLTVDNENNVSKITIYKPLASISEDALLDGLRQLLAENGIVDLGSNKHILEKLTNHDLWKEHGPPPVEELVDAPPQERPKFHKAVLLIQGTLKNASYYDGMELDIKSLDRIIERTQEGTFSSGDQELLRNLMNWGANFYSEKEIEQAKKGVWEVFEKAMHNLLGILVIYRHGVPFNSRDHLRFEGSDPRGATVERVIRPGFKVSAIAENGQRGLVLEKAHVITGKSG